MDRITFQSRISPVTLNEFYGRTARFGQKCFVPFPWTIKESVLSKGNAYTAGIIDCTVCGIGDGDKMLLMHICPSMEENYNFNKIKDYIKSKLTLMNKDYLQGMLVGSQETFLGKSREIFDNFAKFMQEVGIPFTSLRAGYASTNVAYDKVHDEWLISSEDVHELERNSTPKAVLYNMFEEVQIADCDEV